MQQQTGPETGRPSAEPEIIPPGADRQRASRVWVSTGQYHTRVRIIPLGPIAITVLVLLVGILALAGIALLLGAALVGIAVAGMLIVFGIISNVLRREFRRQ